MLAGETRTKVLMKTFHEFPVEQIQILIEHGISLAATADIIEDEFDDKNSIFLDFVLSTVLLSHVSFVGRNGGS